MNQHDLLLAEFFQGYNDAETLFIGGTHHGGYLPVPPERTKLTLRRKEIPGSPTDARAVEHYSLQIFAIRHTDGHYQFCTVFVLRDIPPPTATQMLVDLAERLVPLRREAAKGPRSKPRRLPLP